ncbi:DUF4241 domain-containing protein [Dysosmobacter welbionis]|uniref:DUF4241 domain-containing protein n=2 Tax=Dysosmobacter welbionis TaxID=2093857 RepID=UPI0038B2E752
MSDWAQIISDALDILKFDGAVQDTLAELRRKWSGQIPALLEERFDTLGIQYMKLPHEMGVAALGQELSTFGWALYDLDEEDEYLFVLIPAEERSGWERYCKKQGQYCHLMKQQGRKWGDHAKEQDPGKLMPCEEYILQDEYDYFFNSLAGDFAAGEWKSSHSEEWKYGCVADLRCRPPKVTRSKSLYQFGHLAYSDQAGVYAASGASASGQIGKVLLGKNPSTLNFFEPSPIGYEGAPHSLRWVGNSLWVGDPTNATRIELTDRGTCQDVKNWPLPEDGWSTKYHCGIVTDGLGRVYFSNEWYKGQIYRWENGKVTKHTFSLDGYDHLSEAVPVPGTNCIYMIHSVSGKWRMEECLLELDMDTGRCRIAPLPGLGEELKLRWFTGDWLLVQGNGEILSDDFAQLINMNTREVLRIRPGMFGGEKMQHIGILTDGTVVIVTRRDRVGPVFRYPIDFWGFLRTANKPQKLEPWREYKEVYPNLPIFLAGEEPEPPKDGANSISDTESLLLRPQFDRLSPEEKRPIMERLAAQYRLDFVRMEHFGRWGQHCTTGIFKKDGREFVFVPGDTVILGWEQFAAGLNQESREELEYLFREWEMERDPTELIGESMAPVRRAAIGPMLVGRELEEINWEPVKLDDPRLRPEWLEDFRQFALTDRNSLTLVGRARFERDGDSWQASLYHEVDYPDFQNRLQKQGFSLPTADEWAYLCGGGCRTLFPWGDGLDYSMRLHWFEDMDEDENRPYDMEEPNFFGLSIAYDPYMREVVQADRLTTCGGDGGCNICGGLGPFLGFLPCSPHCKPEVQEDNALNGNYDFYRPIVRIPLEKKGEIEMPATQWLNKYESIKDKLACKTDLDAHFTEKVIGNREVDVLDIGAVHFPSGTIFACDPLVELEDTPPFIQTIPAGTYPVKICVVPSEKYGDRYACVKVEVSREKPVRYELGMTGKEDLDEELDEDEYFGFGVDAGMGCVADIQTQAAFKTYWAKRLEEDPDIDPYNDLFCDLLEENAKACPKYQLSHGDWLNWTVPDTDCNLPIFASGWGDGYYPVYFGYDAKGKVCAVYVRFIDIEASYQEQA